MEDITIKISRASSEEGYFYDIYLCSADQVADQEDSEDGGICTNEDILEAIQMASEQAQALIIRTYRYQVFSPDNIEIEFNTRYKTEAEAKEALATWVKRYEEQGYYSTVRNGERVRIPVEELSDNCEIKNLYEL